MKERGATLDAESGIECQECLHKVLLRPEPVALHDDVTGIVGGKEDVVDVNKNALVELWKYFQVKPVNVVAGLQYMA